MNNKILPCCTFWGKVALGKIEKPEFKEAWNSEKMQDLRKKHLSKYFEIPQCKIVLKVASLIVKPLISVIVLLIRCHKISKAINSLIGQTFENWL